ncbi:peroxidase 3 [Selaginella moellendorffii]|uniref:peroxidase 3 n=1 Tax=Selaginella moellendorffii TaxID=88036 RepID=UPI000D1C3CAE|nr:peroxidase 3 [Selaginella moellendorffii]|eukprot:XP_024540149.1 peroxidase 3 [Selaginella moellendorffii]
MLSIGAALAKIWLVIALGASIWPASHQQQLDSNFYRSRCPALEPISATAVARQIRKDPTSAAPLVRMFFHDCFVQGCDASVLLDSTKNSTAEKEATPNVSLRQFDVLEEIKTQVEAKCPGVVSCADIVALAARDATVQTGGPSWNVEFGRRDGRSSSDAMAAAHLPSSRSSAQPLIDSFAAVGLSIRDLVTLSGAHTFGRAHCTQVARRFYAFNNASGIDPTLDSSYAQRLRRLCPQPLDAHGMVDLDPITPNVFDTLYYQGLLMNLGIFSSDSALVLDNRTKVFVQEYAVNPVSFVQQFPGAMVRLGRIGVLTGSQGLWNETSRVLDIDFC